MGGGGFPKIGGAFKGILYRFLERIYKGSVKGLGFRVSENRGPYYGTLNSRILIVRTPK